MSRENAPSPETRNKLEEFQSAPGSMSRENFSIGMSFIGHTLFQSAPGSMSRENYDELLVLTRLACFNPLPAR